jgi:hypothetical protein
MRFRLLGMLRCQYRTRHDGMGIERLPYPVHRQERIILDEEPIQVPQCRMTLLGKRMLELSLDGWLSKVV